MTTIIVNLKDAGSEFKKLMGKNIKETKEAVKDGMYKSLPDIIRNSPVDTGLFAASWQLTEEESSIILGNFAPHAAIIEFGARPFRPPLRPLLAWAKRVLKEKEYSSRVWALAKYTQQKIQNFGMEPKSILRNSIPMILENIKDELKKL